MVSFAPAGIRNGRDRAPEAADVLNGFATVGYGSLAAGLVAMVVLHATSGLNPLYAVVSVHLYTPLGWLLPVALGLFALGACAFGLMARLAGAPRWLPWSLFAWAAFISVVAIVPSDRMGVTHFSPGHYVHRYAAFAAFCTMAVLGIVLGRWLRANEPGERRNATASIVCGWFSVGVLVLTSAPYVLEWFGIGRPWYLGMGGLLQRLTVLSGLVALVVVGRYLQRVAAAPSSVEALGLGLRPGAARVPVQVGDVAQAPADLGDGVGRPVVGLLGHLGAGVGLGDAVGADGVLRELVPARLAVPQQVEAGELLQVEAPFEGERAAGGAVAAELAAAGRHVH
ncbi:DUF998 domain-containing protein [Glycomyces paridis]|uniref:DUF998 domain-containing protein n=1 Tax=Glycomyces paridis TaxID=2126555 RepID=A0A4S8P0H0_9ACTN|nr:DUF998 domain-containing protein [Glycomyces paridis]